MDARTPLRSMSRTRSSTRYAAGRISARALGLRPHSSLGQETVALRPKMPNTLPSNSQCSLPLGSRMSRGARSWYSAGKWCSNRPGGSIAWSSILRMIMSSRCISCSLVVSSIPTQKNYAAWSEATAGHDRRRGVRDLAPTGLAAQLDHRFVDQAHTVGPAMGQLSTVRVEGQ